MKKSKFSESQIVAILKDGEAGVPPLGLSFRGLLGFHRFYSRALLRAARSRLEAHPK